MIVVTSGAFISSEFQAEIGKIPPSFLPLGNRRFYEHQIERLQKYFPTEQIYITITEAFELSPRDSRRLRELSVQVVFIPDQLKLGESVLAAINSIGIYDEPLRILHGDTLLDEFHNMLDIIEVSQTDDDYNWEVEKVTDGVKEVWCGYFAFSNTKLLAQSLSRNRGDFVAAVRAYHTQQNLESVSAKGWKDLGHINTYYKARAEFTTERAFNQLNIQHGIVRKSSKDSIKISSEWEWFNRLPPALKKYSPNLIQAGEENGLAFYDIEYLPHLPLSELYVFGNLSLDFWNGVFKVADSVLRDFRTAFPDSKDNHSACIDAFKHLVEVKTWKRLNTYVENSGDDLNLPTSLNSAVLPPVRQVVKEAQEAILATTPQPAVVHGDFCFSNLLFDSRLKTLKLIDPRGIDGANKTPLLGDQRYDCAKFIHSVIGQYDSIVSGHFKLEEAEPQNFKFQIDCESNAEQVAEKFLNSSIGRYSAKEMLPLVVLLFFSMLPLHADSKRRQRALYANALRIYAIWKGA